MIDLLETFRKVRLCVVLACALLTLSGCWWNFSSGEMEAPRTNTGPVKVALLLPIGSGTTGDTVVSQNLENAARLAANDLSGVEIDITVYPTARNPSQAAQAAVRAVEQGAEVILGPLFSETAQAVTSALSASDVPVLTFSNNVAIASENTFLLGHTFQNAAEILTRYAVGQGQREIYLLHARNPSGEMGFAAMERALRAEGLQPAGVTGYEFTNEGVVTAVEEAALEVEQVRADTIFLSSDAAGALPLFAQLLPEAGVSPGQVQYMGLARWDIQQIMGFPGIEGGWFALPDPRRTAAFSSRFRSTYGRAPHALAGLAYDGIAAIGVIAGQGFKIDRSSLTQPAGFQGTGGIFRFRPDGTIERGLVVATVEDKQLVVLQPAPVRFGSTP